MFSAFIFLIIAHIYVSCIQDQLKKQNKELAIARSYSDDMINHLQVIIQHIRTPHTYTPFVQSFSLLFCSKRECVHAANVNYVSMQNADRCIR